MTAEQKTAALAIIHQSIQEPHTLMERAEMWEDLVWQTLMDEVAVSDFYIGIFPRCQVYNGLHPSRTFEVWSFTIRFIIDYEDGTKKLPLQLQANEPTLAEAEVQLHEQLQTLLEQVKTRSVIPHHEIPEEDD